MDKPTSRAIPRQSRSQQTLDLILDTAADLFVEVGYENTTTNAIAERAALSIGTLYRYYPDKDAVMKALVNRYYDQQIEMFEHIFVEDMKYLPPEIMIDRLLDPILKLHCGYPAFIHIMLGSDVSTDIASASCELDEEITRRLANFLKMLSPHLQDEQAHLTAVVTKSIFKSSVSMLASSQDEHFQNQVVVEIKKMLLAYLTPILEPQK